MSTHIYPCGQLVTFTDRRHIGHSWSGDFVIIKQLPSGDEAPRYEIKSRGEVYSRVAYEDQLAITVAIFR